MDGGVPRDQFLIRGDGVGGTLLDCSATELLLKPAPWSPPPALDSFAMVNLFEADEGKSPNPVPWDPSS